MGIGKGKHPNSLANLRPFPKGRTGNPNGRPKKGDCVIEIARNSLLEPFKLIPESEFKTMTWEEVSAYTWLRDSMSDPGLRKDLYDRIYGRVPLPVQGQVSGEVIFKVVYENEELKQVDGNSGTTGV